LFQVGEVSKRSSEKWKSLSPEERSIWDKKADEDKKRYEMEKEKYTGPWQVPWKRVKKVGQKHFYHTVFQMKINTRLYDFKTYHLYKLIPPT
jgi:hypothetical protein